MKSWGGAYVKQSLAVLPSHLCIGIAKDEANRCEEVAFP